MKKSTKGEEEERIMNKKEEEEKVIQNIMKNQPVINIGTIGHVNHGKSTLVYALSRTNTQRFEKENRHNKTIMLGYANCKIFKCKNEECRSYMSTDSSNRWEDKHCVKCEKCGEEMKLIRHVSFVDCPGHNSLMSTMITGSTVMDGALLLISANEECPQPQTKEHVAAISLMNLGKIIVCQNKVDTVNEEKSLENFVQIKQFCGKSGLESLIKAPVIPISAALKLNMDSLCRSIEEMFPLPKNPLSSKNDPVRMTILRSFDVNKPGTRYFEMVGGVIGGSLEKGMIEVGKELEIRPGRAVVGKNGEVRCCIPYTTIVTSLKSETNNLDRVIPGGLVGIGTTLDPSLTRKNRLVGQILGERGKMDGVYTDILVDVSLLTRLVGIKGNTKVERLRKGEFLSVTIGSAKIRSVVTKVDSVGRGCILKFLYPKCCVIKMGQKITISRMISGMGSRLIGWGNVIKGNEVPLKYRVHRKRN